mmetsp:Transcript_87742/g.220835  ORF Transcript_87742/g.220835 Transcript_87742/m.220835 type:complete len:154 (-) Transcript_87742:2530-2991(-)
MRDSMVSMSRWLVGSSRTIKCGLHCTAIAKATRLFCPPLSVFTCRSAMSPRMPMLASRSLARCSCLPSSGPVMRSRTHSTHVCVRSSVSTWCWAKSATRMLRLTLTSPFMAGSAPVMTFNSVDLPAPFLPSTPTRLPRSRRTVAPLHSGGNPG